MWAECGQIRVVESQLALFLSCLSFGPMLICKKEKKHHMERVPVGLTWNQGSADENVHLFTLLGEKGHFRLNEFFGHLFGVASDSVAGLLDVDLQRLCPE